MVLNITEDLIKQVARNANLELNDEEIKQFKIEFLDILQYFEKISTAKVSEIPSFHPIKIANKTREDICENEQAHVEVMKNVESSSNGYIRGPKII